MNSISNRIWILMSRSLNGEATAEEENELIQLLAGDDALRQQYAVMRALWRATTPAEPEADNTPESDVNVSRILQLARVEQAVSSTGKSKLRRLYPQRIAIVAAAASALFAVAYWQFFSHTHNDEAVITAQKGSRTQAKLPDGSTVWLNAGSSVTYRNDFAGATREVVLKGEAYFDVVKNAGKPFIVHAAGIDIRVLGTSFNVKAYRTDKAVETTLISGLVQVSHTGSKGDRPILLHPDEKLVIPRKKIVATDIAESGSNDDNATEGEDLQLTESRVLHLDGAQTTTILAETAWIYNRLVFNGESFGELAPQLERWYNIQVVFTDDRLKKLQFNGSFENETVEQAFTALSTAVPFRFRTEGHKVLVSPE